MSALGTILRDRLEEKGWSMRELARRAGLPAATVQKVITSESIMPATDTVRALAAALGLPDRTLLRAAAIDGGYVTAAEGMDAELQALMDGISALPVTQRDQVSALVEAMLRVA